MTMLFLAWLDVGCPPRDPLRHDAAWLLWTADLKRRAYFGIPGVFQ